MRTILLGSNPSQSSPDSSPFHVSTRSRIIIDRWFEGIDATDRVFLNVSDKPKEGNKPLTSKEIAEEIWPLMCKLEKYPNAFIITLGKTPARAMTIIKGMGYGYNFFEMPHPSGRNRLLNDPKYIEEKIKKLQEFLGASSKI
jgi:uracil-DNA glycosylase